MVDSSGIFEGFMLGFAADAKDSYILHGFRKLNHRLTLNGIKITSLIDVQSILKFNIKNRETFAKQY